MGEGEHEAGQGDDRERAGQSVDAVDEIDGIRDEHDDADGNQRTYPPRHLTDAEESVEVGEVESRQRQCRSGQYLHDELVESFQSDNVVDKSGDIDGDGTEQEIDGPQAQLDARHPLPACHAEGDDTSHQHTGQEHHASHPGNGALVYLPVIRQIIEPLALAEVEYQRDGEHPTGHAAYQGDDGKYDVAVHISSSRVFFYLTPIFPIYCIYAFLFCLSKPNLTYCKVNKV